uniref:Elongator complex protein 4 n=1 Tax=Auxenochlorella protothecoides TaxID=3075 RepID=A0A1D2A899_AUXPR
MPPGSSFQRKGAVAVSDPRTRPGQHGQTVISSGLADVDAIFGGGYPLGSLILLLEDGSTHLHHLLVQYFLAEGVVSGQSVLLGHGEQGPAPSLAAWLPAQLQTKDKEPPGVEAEGDAGLRIAWQYRRYITKAQQQQEGIGTAVGRGSGLGPSSSGGIATAGRAAPPSKPRPWATAFDLRKAAGAEVLDAHRHRVVSLCCEEGTAAGTHEPVDPARALLREAGSFVAGLRDASAAPAPGRPTGTGPAPPGGECSASGLATPTPSGAPLALPAPSTPTAPRAPLPPRSAEAVGRLVFTGLAGGSWPEGAEAGLAPLLSGIRARVRAAAAVALVTLSPAGLAPAVLAQAQHAADAVLALETVASDAELVRMVPDPGSIAGLLCVRRLPLGSALQPPVPDAPLHLIRSVLWVR